MSEFYVTFVPTMDPTTLLPAPHPRLGLETWGGWVVIEAESREAATAVADERLAPYFGVHDERWFARRRMRVWGRGELARISGSARGVESPQP